jgi:DNA-directed RNA polymerase subunit RPC12/RpoP
MEQITVFELLGHNKKVKDQILPKGITLKKNESWCPYCSTKVILKKDKRFGVRLCPICGISENDYFVKKVNRRK